MATIIDNDRPITQNGLLKIRNTMQMQMQVQMPKAAVVAGALVFAALAPASGFSAEDILPVFTGLDSGTIGGHATTSVYEFVGQPPWEPDATRSCGTALSLTILQPIAAPAPKGAWNTPGAAYGAPVLTLTLAASGNRLDNTLHDSLDAFYPSAYPVVEPPAEIVPGPLNFYGTDGTAVFVSQSGTAVAETILCPLSERFIDFPRGISPVLVPEPSTFALLSIGVMSLVFSIRSRQ